MKDNSAPTSAPHSAFLGQNEPKTWTFVIKGYQVEYRSLRKCSLFMYEICKCISAYETARIALERNSAVPEQQAVTIICAITESLVLLETDPYHKFARLMISARQQIQEAQISDLFGQFFQPDLKMENYIESPR